MLSTALTPLADEITLEKGVWNIYYVINFQFNVYNTVTDINKLRRVACLFDGQTAVLIRELESSGIWKKEYCSAPLIVEEKTTYVIGASQNTGSAQNIAGACIAVKLG